MGVDADIEIASVVGGYLVTVFDEDKEEMRPHVCTTIDEVIRLTKHALENIERTDTASVEEAVNKKRGKKS